MKYVDLSEECKFLLGTIEKNCRKAQMMREQIKRLKVRETIATEEDVTFSDEVVEDLVDDDESDSFEDEVDFYLSDYRDLDDDFSKEDLISVLPKRKNYSFEKILLRLQAESLKEIKEIQEILLENEDVSLEELNEYRQLLEVEQRKILLLKEILTDDEDVIDMQEEENNIILVPTLYGNIRVLEELDSIPAEFYPAFAELIQSIIDGTFKGVKRFTNNRSLNGITEVRGFQVRIAFTRVGKNTYALITAFTKKDTISNGYMSTLAKKIAYYRQVAKMVKDNMNNPEFMEENEKNVDKLLELLSIEKKNKGAK